MRARLITALLAVLAAFVLGAGTTSAAVPVPAGWSVSPGGVFSGTGGAVDPPLNCTGTDFGGTFASGSGLTTLAVISRLVYRNCKMPGVPTLGITLRLPWSMHGLTHANGVTTLEIRNVAANISGPGCNLSVAGKVTATYSNATGILTVVDHDTVVGPGSYCLGLVAPGDTVALLSSTSTISPRHIITPTP
jgi:hypothetical protein